ncbi:MAG: biotin/lipoyl-binding protein [Candidatus Aminicenantes bacterium]|nr:biotin/lipoyl-binding protein [Candidatus Aminicenantes bacterium]
MDFSFWLDNKEYRLNLEERVENEILVSLGKKQYRVSVEFISGDEILLNIDGRIHNVIVNSNTLFYSVYVNGRFFKIEKKSVSKILGKRGAKTQKRDIKTSMPGRIVKVFIKEGDKVKEDQAVLVLEAMKMQNEIKSPQSGVIIRIGPAAGDSVEAGALLFSVE